VPQHSADAEQTSGWPDSFPETMASLGHLLTPINSDGSPEQRMPPKPKPGQRNSEKGKDLCARTRAWPGLPDRQIVNPRQIRGPGRCISIVARLRYCTALLSAVGLRLIGRVLPAGNSGKLGGFAGGVSPGARKQRAPITRTSDLCMRMFPDSSNSPQRRECD
jgi:hypothetical protein